MYGTVRSVKDWNLDREESDGKEKGKSQKSKQLIKAERWILLYKYWSAGDKILKNTKKDEERKTCG